MGLVLDLKNVTKKYPGVDALKDFSLSLDRGKIVGLLGPNGSGKTTLMKLIMGFIKPQKGEVKVLGVSPNPMIREKIAYVSELDVLYPWMTVREILDFTSHFYRDWEKAKESELLQLLAIEQDKKIGTFSYGMRTRVRVMLALCRKPELVLLDDPFSGIDLVSREKVQDALLKTYHYKEQSIVLATHIIDEAEPLFDEVVFIEKGKINLQGKADDLREKYSKNITDIYKEVFK
ncbi:MAG: ABC transporter ATP-binding protein [bacterium]|nr:ABC transporter ATP-binding protein [bacterium]